MQAISTEREDGLARGDKPCQTLDALFQLRDLPNPSQQDLSYATLDARHGRIGNSRGLDPVTLTGYWCWGSAFLSQTVTSVSKFRVSINS